MVFEVKAEKTYNFYNVAEWSSSVARRAHNPKVVGSNPASAIYHVYAPNDANAITGGVYFCNIGLYKKLNAHVIEMFSIFLQLWYNHFLCDHYIICP